jgi:hypothetical protein
MITAQMLATPSWHKKCAGKTLPSVLPAPLKYCSTKTLRGFFLKLGMLCQHIIKHTVDEGT